MRILTADDSVLLREELSFIFSTCLCKIWSSSTFSTCHFSQFFH